MEYNKLKQEKELYNQQPKRTKMLSLNKHLMFPFTAFFKKVYCFFDNPCKHKIKTCLFILVLGGGLLSPIYAQLSHGVYVDEYNALVDLYNATNGPNWTSEQSNPDDNWLTSALVEDWYGVAVDNNHVVSIDLNNNNLDGIIPNSIGDLIGLQLLYLHYNQLTGSIPSSIGNLASLEVLYLFDNQLTGSIPS